ncbi:MAG: carboxypeptidase-like regulatory domain-containing protein [Flavobacterium sp.]|nr:carboxypeptidase-like regulatory domain-containing protein [Flavobacterium sp.]
MKKIIAQILILVTAFTFAQTRTISGVIKDKETKLPIESVSISVENSSIGTISNEEGKFRITLPTPNAKIFFSHVYYNSISIVASNDSDEVEVFLDVQIFELEEVVVNKFPGKVLLKMAVDASKTKLEKALLLNTYYREFINVDGKFTSFADGLVDYYVKRKSGASDLQVKQSRVFDLKDATANERQQAIMSVNLNNIQDAIEYGYNFKGINSILKSEDYDFYAQTKKMADGSSIDIVSIEPKEGIEEEMIFAGTVVFDSKTKLILDVDLAFSPEHKKFNELHNLLIAKVKFNNYARKAKYKIDGDKYVLVYYQSSANVYIKFGNKIDNTFESTCDLTVLNYKEGEFKLDKESKFKGTSLFMNGNKYTEEFWKKYDVILLSDKEEKLLKSLQQ